MAVALALALAFGSGCVGRSTLDILYVIMERSRIYWGGITDVHMR